MPKMYKPNRVTMYPNNDTIDPTITNIFSFVFNGEVLSEYTYSFYDLFSGELKTILNIPLGSAKHNGEVVTTSFAPPFFNAFLNAQMSYDVRVFGQAFIAYGILPNDRITIAGANYGFAEPVFLSSDWLFGPGIQDVFLVPTSTTGDYYAFLTLEAARNGRVIDRLHCAAGLSVTAKSSIRSEQIPFRTSRMPTMTLSTMLPTSGSFDVVAAYLHTDGYALNRFNVTLYDNLDKVLLKSADIYSSYPHYNFTNLANAESYKVQFTGYSVLEQYVDTGKVAMYVLYPSAISAKSYTIAATNDCINGRVNIVLQTTPTTFSFADANAALTSIFTVESILIYRQEYGVALPEIIASLPPQTIVYSDYMAQSSKRYRYWMGFYGAITAESASPILEMGAYYVVPNTIVTAYVTSDYYGWFLVDLDADKSYAFDVQFEGGELTQEDDFTKYKTNLLYNSYSVGNIQTFSSNMTGLISIANLGNDFTSTNVLLAEIANLVSPRYHGRKIIKDRRVPTRIFPVFTYGFKEMPLHNGVGSQPYLCSFSWDQIGNVIE